MKLETIVKRYELLGYTPKGLELDLEVASIIKWIFEEFKIYIDVTYCDFEINDCKSYQKFTSYSLWNVGTEFSYRNSENNWFENPFDAKFDYICKIVKIIRFQFYGNVVNKKYVRNDR